MPGTTTGEVIIKLLGDVSGFSSAMRKAQWDSATLGQKMTAVGGIMSSVGRTMTLGLTIPIVAGFALATKAAVEEEKEMALLAEAMRTNADATDESIDATEKWVTAQQNATGIADGELRPALASLVAATKDVGKAQELLGVAMDISAAKGKPLAAVTAALQKAYLGNVGGLARLGIATKDAEGKTLSFEAVMRNAIATYGGAAAVAASTTAGKMAILKAKMQDIAETVGAMFIPILGKAVDVLAGLADRAASLPPFWQKVAVALAAVVAAAGPLLLIVGKLLVLLGTLMPVLSGLAPMLGAVGAAFSVGGFSAGIAALAAAVGPIGLVVAGVAALAAVLAVVYAKSETFRALVSWMWKVLVAEVQWVVDTVGPLLRALWDGIIAGAEWMKKTLGPSLSELWASMAPALQAASELIQQVFATIVTGVTEIVAFIKENWDTIGPIIKAAWDVGMTYTKAFFEILAPIIQAIAALLRGDFTNAWDHAKNVVQLAADNMGKIMQALATLFGMLAKAAMLALLEAIKAGAENAISYVASMPERIAAGLKSLTGLLAGIAKAAMSGFLEKIKEIGNNAIEWLHELPGRIKGVFSGASGWLYSAGLAIMRGLLDGIIAAWNSVASYLSGLAGKIRDLKGPLEKDRKLLYPAGVAIMAGLQDGLEQGASGVLGMMSGFGGRLSAAGSVGAVAVPAAVAAGGGGRRTVINQYFSVQVSALEPDERLAAKLLAKMQPVMRRAGLEMARGMPR